MTQLLSVAHAAERLDCSAGHVYGLIAVGKLRAVEIKATGTRPKTRVREEDLEAFIEAQTRVVAERSSGPTRQPELYTHLHSLVSGNHQRATYDSVSAAAYAEVTVDAVTAALRAGNLHGAKASGGRWRVEHECLVAWLEGRPCEDRDGGGRGEVRRIDGT